MLKTKNQQPLNEEENLINTLHSALIATLAKRQVTAILMREKGKQPFVHVTLHKNQRIGKTSKQTLVLLADGTSASFTMKNRYFRLEQGVRLWKKLFLKMT